MRALLLLILLASACLTAAASNVPYPLLTLLIFQITLGVMLPSAYSFLTRSVSLGFAAVTSEQLLPSGVTMDYVYKDDVDQGAALLAANDLSSQCPCRDGEPVVGVIGPAFSSHATLSQLLFAHANVPQISPSATDSTLSDKSLYPTFMRMVPTDQEQTKVIASFVRQYGWTRVAFYYTNEAYGSSGFASFGNDAAAAGINIVAAGSVAAGGEADLAPLFASLVSSDARIVILFGTNGFCMEFMLQAAQRSLTGPGYVYILSDSFVPEIQGAKVSAGTYAICAHIYVISVCLLQYCTIYVICVHPNCGLRATQHCVQRIEGRIHRLWRPGRRSCLRSAPRFVDRFRL